MENTSKNDVLKIKCLPLPSCRKTETSNKFQTCCVRLDSVELINESEEFDSLEVQAFLFDSKFKAFIGSCWKGKSVTLSSKKVKLNQCFYFYTSVPGKELFVVLEIVTCGRSLGWLYLPVIENDNSAVSLEHSISYKMSLFTGSPLALLILKDLNSLSKRTNGIELSFLLMPYPLLLQIAHLVPENILIDTFDAIPGLLPTGPTGAGVHLKLHLQKCFNYLLSDICIRVHPSVKEFEKDLIEKILKEQQDQGSKEVEASKFDILQRRLRIGIHNGYTFIQECDIFHLCVEPIVTPKAQKSHHRSSSLGSINYSRETGLRLRSDVKMPSVPDDPNIAIVFFLEYTVSLPWESTSGVNSISKSPTSTVSIAWGHAELESLKAAPSQTVRLSCNAVGSPFSLLFLIMPNVLELSFKAAPLVKQNKVASSGQSVGNHGSTNSFSAKTYLSPETSYLHSPAISLTNHKHKSVGDIPGSIAQIEARPKEFNSNLQEVTLVSSSLPLVPPVLHNASMVSHSCFTKLFWDQLEPVLDHQGKPATVLDLPYSVNQQLEFSTPPQQNECSLRIFAISGLEKNTSLPSEIFFTFQFYRFLPVRTESLVLKPLSESKEGASLSQVFALMKPGQLNKSPGFQVAYKLDPSELGIGEYRSFLNYLMKQTLLIDLWNGQSSLYFGSVLLPLKYLCRQGKDAVSASFEFDIVDCEFPDENLSEMSVVSASQKGKLHVRLSCVRYPLAPKSLEKIKSDSHLENVVFYGKNSSNTLGPTVSKARPLVETNRELTHYLAARNANNGQDSCESEERKRKLARMEAVLKLENGRQNSFSESDSLVHFLKERDRDLFMVDSYIQKNKTEMIESLLNVSVTQEQTIYPTIGSKSFFEFVLENPFSTQKKVEILWNCPELRLVTNIKFWRELLSRHGLPQKVNPISFIGETSLVLAAKELIHIPFTFYSYSFSNRQQLEVFKTSSGHYFTSEMLSSSSPMLSNLMPYTVKVRFMTDDQVLLAFLILHIQPLPPSPTHVFKFLSMEHSMFKKCIRLDHSGSELSAISSNSDATCSIVKTWEGGIQIHLKAPTKAAGQMRNFCIFLYQDNPFEISPFQVWHVTVCPLQRVDLSCTSGQLMRSSLLIRGSHVTHLVQCFSNSPCLQLHPNQPFLLTPFVPHELSLCVRPLVPGIKYFQISMVNRSLELILQSWLLVLSCKKPTISKAFQVHLNIGKEVTKRITYTSPYRQEKCFSLYSSHLHVLRPWEERFEVEAGQSHALGLHFLAQQHIFSETVFLYLNDEGDKNEETYCIKVTCQ